MGHYDSCREANERLERKKRAAQLGVSVENLDTTEEHLRKMSDGERLLKKRQEEDSLIRYYLENRSTR